MYRFVYFAVTSILEKKTETSVYFYFLSNAVLYAYL